MIYGMDGLYPLNFGIFLDAHIHNFEQTYPYGMVPMVF